MQTTISPIIKANELIASFENENFIFVDASSSLNAKMNFEKLPFENKILIDLNTDLADIKQDVANGGRHPLPKVKDFVQTISKLGITPESNLVVFDDKNGSNAAARFWWMMKAIGHEKIRVLDGGIQEILKLEYQGIKKNKSSSCTINRLYDRDCSWKHLTVDIKDVEMALQSPDFLVIDVREEKRYLGVHEPIDLVAGHIPGAINFPFTENLDTNGCFLSPEALKLKYEKCLNHVKSENVILHCGSGVTACHSILAMNYAGLPMSKLYVGSWSEWSRNNKPIATDKND